VAFANVLMDVLDGVDSGANLHVEVALVLEEERRVVGGDVAVVQSPVDHPFPGDTGT
jgi:hypothetical protein